MSFLFQIQKNEIIITGYEGPVSYLQIPETLEDRPVTQIAASAFSGRTDLIYAKLPATITKLGRFAFYGCSALEKISLSDGIIDYGDGVFRQCRNMHEAELDIREQRYYVLKELLADTDRVITADITFPGGRARLTFPEYLFEYIEDTRARAIHLHIEGTGYNYRECVSRKSIDFRSYDRSFEKLRSASPSLACRIAMDRLCFPYNLENPHLTAIRNICALLGKMQLRWRFWNAEQTGCKCSRLSSCFQLMLFMIVFSLHHRKTCRSVLPFLLLRCRVRTKRAG